MEISIDNLTVMEDIMMSFSLKPDYEKAKNGMTPGGRMRSWTGRP